MTTELLTRYDVLRSINPSHTPTHTRTHTLNTHINGLNVSIVIVVYVIYLCACYQLQHKHVLHATLNIATQSAVSHFTCVDFGGRGWHGLQAHH